MSMELLELPNDVTGLALNLESDNVGAVLFGEWDQIEEGDQVKRTGRLLDIPVGDALLGRIVDPLGRPLDGKGDIETTETRPAAVKAPGPGEGQPADKAAPPRRVLRLHLPGVETRVGPLPGPRHSANAHGS